MIEFPNIGIKFETGRIATVIFGMEIYKYGVIITLGIALALLFAYRKAPFFGVPPDNAFDIAFASILGGIIGARLYYVLFNLKKYNLHSAIFGIRDGGLGVYGGIILGALVATFLCRIKKIKFAPFLDLAALSIFIGQGIGRWGNFFNQEAYGDYTNSLFAMSGSEIPQLEGYKGVHPCFLYESVWCILGFSLLLFYSKYRTFDGELFCIYTFWYGIGRFFIEGTRTDSLMLFDFKISQIVAVISILVSMFLFIKYKIKTFNAPSLYVNANSETLKEELLKSKIKAEKEAAVRMFRKQTAYLKKYNQQNQEYTSIFDNEEESEKKD